MIRSPEDSLGARLFDRTTRAVEPTVEGALFLDPARRLLQDMRLATDDVRDHVRAAAAAGGAGRIARARGGLAAAVLAAFRKEYLGIGFNLADVLSESCAESVRTGRADLALAAVRATAPELSVEPFLSDDFYLVCRRDHPMGAAAGPGWRSARTMR